MRFQPWGDRYDRTELGGLQGGIKKLESQRAKVKEKLPMDDLEEVNLLISLIKAGGSAWESKPFIWYRLVKDSTEKERRTFRNSQEYQLVSIGK